MGVPTTPHLQASALSAGKEAISSMDDLQRVAVFVIVQRIGVFIQVRDQKKTADNSYNINVCVVHE